MIGSVQMAKGGLTMDEAKAWVMITRLRDSTDEVIGMRPLVLCKDCKHGEKTPTFKYYPLVTWCNKYLTSHNDEWYCADGERE